MAALLFICPKTKGRIPTGVETDVAGLRQSWSRTLVLACPHCGGQHEISVRETYLNAALDERIGAIVEAGSERSAL
jgi:hypothetical protein